jgi:hypothetical protein
LGTQGKVVNDGFSGLGLSRRWCHWLEFSVANVCYCSPGWNHPGRCRFAGRCVISVFWHLGFWEWTGAAAVFVFLCAAVFLRLSHAILPKHRRAPWSR